MSPLRIILVILIGILPCGCKGKDATPGPNVVLITIDTLRADHLSCYGYERPTTPFIDSIAREGSLFNNAYSTSSWTAPSMASIFTGLYPREHGVLHGFVNRERKELVDQEVLSSDFLTLPETLKKMGYKTFGVSSNGHMAPETGFAQGFDYFTTMWFRASPAPNNAAKEWRNQLKGAGKYFFWIHYFDPHEPYTAREPWISLYSKGSEAYKKWSDVMVSSSKEQFSDGEKADGKKLQALVALHDSEISFCDHELQDLFETLSLRNNSLIIITSDHGEEFLEHGGLGHGNSLYEEVIRVPLIIRLPRGEAVIKSVDQPVSNKDILPTILDLLGVTLAPSIRGRSLAPLIKEGTPVTAEPVYAELDRGNYWKAVRDGNWKFMYRGRGKKEGFLFDLDADPGEKNNAMDSFPDKAESLKGQLEGWVAYHPVYEAPRMERALSRSDIERLRSLGYVK